MQGESQRFAGARVLMRMAWALGALLALLSIGTWGFLRFGGPGTEAFDAFYMTAITITTVGYGEVVDLSHSDAGRLFAAFVAFAGFGIITFLFSSLTVFFLEVDLNEALRRRRMDKAIRKLRNHYIVCGFGRVGRNVATELMASRHKFVAIEINPTELDPFLTKHPALLYLQGDASDDELLQEADIADAKGVFAVTATSCATPTSCAKPVPTWWCRPISPEACALPLP
jgi:voltage-gated potassium channel